MRAILLIMIGFSILYADFTKSGNIVTDSVTGLQWQDDAIGTSTTWQDAIDRCENLTLDGLSDWRLPNINELKSIVDRSKYNPAIVNGFSQVSSNDDYWSSTALEEDRGYAWVVFFGYGLVDSFGKDNSFYARCVRAGQ